MPAVSVCIPVHGRFDLTQACLESLRKTSPPNALEVIVVDNASTDGTEVNLPRLGECLFGGAFVYKRLSANKGFAVACNTAARLASTDMLFFLNNDTIVEDGWLTPLLAALASDDRLAAVGPLLLYPETRRVQHCGVAFDPFSRPHHIYEHFPALHPIVRRRRPLQALTAAALMMRRDTFLQHEGFHEGYLNGYEDLDLCLHIRAKGGRLACILESRILHHVGCTPGRFENESGNSALFRSRCGELVQQDIHRLYTRDGFDVRFNAWLGVYGVQPEEQLRGLDEAPFSGREALRCAVEQHPLWPRGYQKWRSAALQDGCKEEALQASFLEAVFFPSRTAFDALIGAADALHNTYLRESAVVSLTHAEAEMADKGRLKARAEAVERAAKACGDDVVLRMCTEWKLGADTLGLLPHDEMKMA